MKCSGIKAEIIGSLVTDWKAQCDVQPECDGEEQGIPASVHGTFQSSKTSASRDLPVFEAILSWTKNVSSVRGYTFMKEGEDFNTESMRVFKSLKAYN